MSRIIKALFLLLLSVSTTAQQPVYSHSKWFNVENGLPQGFVSSLQQDKDGFLWVGTRDGLARYDGRTFKVFRHQASDPSTLSSNVITDLFLDAQNRLWVFYINEKVDCFDPRLMQVSYRDSFNIVRKLLSELKIKKFTRDRSGRFWFVSKSRGIICYDPLSNKTQSFDSLQENQDKKIGLGVAEDSKGHIYTFAASGISDLGIHAKQVARFYPFPTGLNIDFKADLDYPSLVLPDSRLVLANSNKLVIFDPVKKIFEAFSLPGSSKNTIRHLQVGKNGLLYLEAGGAVYRFDKNNQFTWLWQSTNSNPFANECISFLVDRSFVMWFGTNASGMYKVDLMAMPFNGSVYNINFTSDILSGITGSIDKLPAGLKEGQWAYNLRSCYDRDKRLWVTYKYREWEVGPLSLYTLNDHALVKVPVPAGNYPAIKGLSLAPSGNMYAVDLRGNMWRWKNSVSLPEFIPTNVSYQAATAVIDIETDDHTSWLSTDKEGLYRIENNKLSRHFSVNSVKNWPSDQLTDLFQDPADKQHLWIGTMGSGLIRLNTTNENFEVFTTEKNLPNNTVYSIVPDQQGNLWISTNKGITRFTPATGNFYNFDSRDGLIGNEFNRFHHLLLPGGEIAFGGPAGYTILDPLKFRLDTFSTTVGLIGLLINNKQVAFSSEDNMPGTSLNELKKLVLPYNKNFLQFEFAGLQFNQPEKIRYRYMLKGYDKEWINAGEYNIAGYTRLPPGRYSLQLNASNTSGNWSKEVKQIAIRIRPPIWATWWAWSIYALVLLLLGRIYWNYRANRIRLKAEINLEQSKARHLKEVDEMKDRFFSNITHELRTPLTLILTPLEKLKDKDYLPAVDKRTLSNSYKNAEQLLRLINQLLDLSKIESNQMKVNPTVGELAGFVESCVQQFSTQAKESGIDLRFINNNISGIYMFDQEKWEKIIFNLVGNALKFTEAGDEVRVSISSLGNNKHPHHIQLAVADSGRGIPAKDIPKLFDRFFMVDDSTTKKQGGTGIGLALVKELTTVMNGSIDVKSKPGEGSVFTVELPVEKIPASMGITNIHPGIVQKDRIVSKQEIEKPMLLVVEDNEELLGFLVESLSSDWRIIQASNGRSGWELIIQELPDLVVSDVMMPEMDGYELCHRVKEDSRTWHIGFVLLSARAAHESRLTGLRKGADEYLTKPFHLDELEQKLHNLADQQIKLRESLQKDLLPKIPLDNPPHILDIFMKELYLQLDQRADNPQLSVESLAQSVNMSQRTLNRKLKAIINLTPVELIRQFRLQKAALLLSSGQPITDTAYQVGFETASYFTQCFKEQFGKTPTEFVNQKTA